MIEAMSNPPAEEHIAACGLFCTNCDKFKAGKCPGCQIAPGYRRSAVRMCCVEKGITTCAECDELPSPASYRNCKNLNSLIARAFALVYRSDRPAALALLRDEGKTAYLQTKRDTGKQ